MDLRDCPVNRFLLTASGDTVFKKVLAEHTRLYVVINLNNSSGDLRIYDVSTNIGIEAEVLEISSAVIRLPT